MMVIADAQQTTVSASKIVNTETETLPDVLLSGFRLMDVNVLADIFTSLACPQCFSTHSQQLHDINDRKKGLARFFQLRCNVCPFVKDFYSSKQVDRHPDNKKGGEKYMEVNLRAVYGMCSISVAHKPLKIYVVS